MIVRATVRAAVEAASIADLAGVSSTAFEALSITASASYSSSS